MLVGVGSEPTEPLADADGVRVMEELAVEVTLPEGVVVTLGDGVPVGVELEVAVPDTV